MSDNQTTEQRQRIRGAFSRAADHYDEVAVLQQEVARRLLDRLALVRIHPQRVADLGTGTGQCAAGLLERYPQAGLVGVDFALPMLGVAAGRTPQLMPVAADIEQLPLAGGSVDLLLSSLTLQWCNSHGKLFRELLRVAAPGALLMFTTFGPDTLTELRSAWQMVDREPHVNRFVDMHDLGDSLLASGWSDPVLDRQLITLTYGEVRGLLHDLRGMGADTVLERTGGGGLGGRRRLLEMESAYESFRQQGRLPATFEVIFGHAWAPMQRCGDSPGTVTVPMRSIAGRGRYP
jgi:malonyl-CoA O-methyltransferase